MTKRTDFKHELKRIRSDERTDYVAMQAGRRRRAIIRALGSDGFQFGMVRCVFGICSAKELQKRSDLNFSNAPIGLI